MKSITITKGIFDPSDIETISVSDGQLKQIEEILKPKSNRWRPEKNVIGTTYYGVSSSGNTYGSTWLQKPRDYFRLGQNNVFKTKEEAEQHAKYLRAISDVTNYCYDNDLVLEDVDWNGAGTDKWNMYYNFDSTKFNAVCYLITKSANVLPYLKSEEACQQVIDEQKDNLEIIFDVK